MKATTTLSLLWMASVLTGCGNPMSPGKTDLGTAAGGSIQFTTSGEALSLGGYGFPPAAMSSPAFSDGWEVKFTKLLVTLDKVVLSEGPDTSATDQSQTGKKVAEVDGPWAIDLHKGGPLPGKGGGNEQSLPVVALDKQNMNGNQPFDATQRYAFGFDLVPATATATRLNVDATDLDYAEMIAKGYVVFYIGTATWKGDQAMPACTTTNAAYDFTKLPKVVHFRLGFKSPTTYVNCQNPDNDPAKGLGTENHQRGVQVKANATTIAQATVHTDHPFWESFTHDTPAHFDPLAALAKKDVMGNFNVTLDDTVGANYTAFKDQMGNGLPWRACQPGYTPPNSTQVMGFDSLTVPYNPAGDPSKAMRDYHDYMLYVQSTQGHLNSDGLCFVKRHYPSPQ